MYIELSTYSYNSKYHVKELKIRVIGEDIVLKLPSIERFKSF